MAASAGYILAQLERWTSPRLEELSDAELLQRFRQQRDESAFAALMTRYGGMVFRSCRRLLGDVHEAEDAFQATFLILARKAHTLRQPSALPGYLHSIARRVALKARAKAAACAGNSPRIEKLADPHADPLMQLTARELLTVLDEEVARLPAKQRSAVVLCCLEGHTREEAAKLLSCTPGSLKGHLERGRQRLQDRLQRRGIALSAVLALMVLGRDRVAAHVPALLLQSTIRAALHGGGGSTAAALASSVLQAMLLPKLVSMIAVTLSVALAASAMMVFVYHGPAAISEDNTAAVPVMPKDPIAGTPRARKDAFGDPLPEGAIARLGTVRFRHGGSISFLSFLPDEKRLISRGTYGVSMWETATGKELCHVPLPANWEWRTTDLSPDGKRLAVIDRGASNPVQLWDADSGKKVGSLGANLRPPIRFSPDGKWLAAAARNTEIELWDIDGKKKLGGWNAHDVELRSIDFSADSRKLLTCDQMGLVRLWDAASGRKLREFEPLSFDPTGPYPASNVGPTLSAHGKLLAILEVRRQPVPTPIANPKARISIWDTSSGKLLRELTCPSRESFPGYADCFSTLTFAPDGKRLVTTGPDRFLRFWDPATGEELHRVPIDTNIRAFPLAFSKDGKKLALGDYSRIRILDMATGKTLLAPGEDTSTINAAILAPDGQTAITGSMNNPLLLWDVATGRVRRRLQGHEKWIVSLHLSPDGRTLYSTGGDNTLRVWDLATGEERKRIPIGVGNLWPRHDPIGSPDGKALIAIDSNRTIRVLDMATGQEKRRFQLERLCGLLSSADGRSLVGCSSNGKLRLWDVASGRTLRDFPLPLITEGMQLYSMALSSDGRLVAVGSLHQIGVEFPREDFLLLVDLNSGHEVYRLDKLRAGAVNVLAFSPDGRTLAWGGFEHPEIRLVETATGRERRRLTGHRGSVDALSFCADGRRLLSGSDDSTALVWDLGRDRIRGPTDAAEIEMLWADLAGEDAARAYRAILRLASAPNVAIPFMRKRMTPVPAADEKRLDHLIAALDSEEFAAREKATMELRKIGEKVLPAYQKALDRNSSLESRRRLAALQAEAYRAWWDTSGERLRSMRAIETLELAAATEAREVLKLLAAGAAAARLTHEAKAALQRLTHPSRARSAAE